MQTDSLHSHAERVLSHLYITPLERCNLCCKMCYTSKSSDILSNNAILDFVSRYRAVHELKMVTFCGGEVMLLLSFPSLVNELTNMGIFVQIITNGTADTLDKFNDPNNINLIVSLDGPEEYHDNNRGRGNFSKSMTFLKKAQKRGFHIEIFSIATHENIPLIPEFEKYLETELGTLPDITYHPRKNLSYLRSHPVSNQNQDTLDGFGIPTPAEIESLSQSRQVFPPPNLGCYQLSLMSSGQVNACCEGIRPLGNIHTPIPDLIATFHARLQEWAAKYPGSSTLGCVEPDFVCGQYPTPGVGY